MVDGEDQIYNIENARSVRITAVKTGYAVTGVILKSLKDGEGTLGPVTFIGEPGEDTNDSFVISSSAIDTSTVSTVFGSTV